MSEFAAILSSLEGRSAGRGQSRIRELQFRVQLGETHGHAMQGARETVKAYAAHAPRAEPAQAREPDADALRQAIAHAGQNERKLRTLRRHAARALHPDRGGDGAALAECNALIDAALRTSRRRT